MKTSTLLMGISIEAPSDITAQELFDALNTLRPGRISLVAFVKQHEVPERAEPLLPVGIEVHHV